MDKIVYSLVYNRKGSLNKRGTALVQVQAYLRGKRKFFSTHVYLSPRQWNPCRQQVKCHPNAGRLNRQLHAFMAELERTELDLHRQEGYINLDLLKQALSSDLREGLFIPFCRHELDNASLRDSSKRNLETTLRLLKDYRDEPVFTDLTPDFIRGFERFLYAQGSHTNTVAKHLKHLKRFVNLAIAREHIDPFHHPFRNFRIKTTAYKHTCLTPQELSRLERFAVTALTPQDRHVLDAFLFCCYTGLRYSDFTHLTRDNIVGLANGPWLIYTTIKTRTEVRLPLNLLFGRKALPILQRYRCRLTDFFRLPDNSNVNKCLRRLAQQAKLGKPISFHTARHTNATLLIYSGVNITTVQRLLGHKSVKTTQVYACVMDMTVMADLKRNHVKQAGQNRVQYPSVDGD